MADQQLTPTEADLPHEVAQPLTMAGYADKFSSLFSRASNEDHVKSELVRGVIKDHGLDQKPITLLTIGAGRGNFELKLVQELGLRVRFIYAVEPNSEHVLDLRRALEEIGCEFEIDEAFYSKDYEMELKAEYEDGFDMVLMSHCLYCITDPTEAAVHATRFLRPSGKLFILHHGNSGSAAVFKYLLNRSDPDVFSSRTVVADHSVTADKISDHITETRPDLSVTVVERPTYTDMDVFVRETDDVTRNDDVISFFLQAEYKDLSLRGRREVWELVKEGCDEVEGRFRMRHECVGIVVTRSRD